MPLTFTAAHSSRVGKSRSKKNVFDRAAASSFARLARQQGSSGSSQARAQAQTTRPPSQAQAKKKAKDRDEDEDDEFFGERLEDHGLITTLETDLSLRDVVPTMQYIQSSMFDPVPLEKSGLRSTQISQMLNFRRALPPLVTNAHIHAVVQSPTTVEREIAALARAGLVRRVRVPGRGVGGAAIGDGLALTADWASLVQRHDTLNEALKEKYVAFLNSGEADASVLANELSSDDLTALMRAGFVTASSAALRAAPGAFAASVSASKPLSRHHALAASRTSFESVSRAASGSADAVGGVSATLDAGGGGGAASRSVKSGGSGGGSGGGSSVNSSASYDVRLTLPSTGSYLKLVHGARNAVLAMLKRTKHGEAPVYLLRERWDGEVANRHYGRSRDPFAKVLPAKIRKWKEFSGLRFDWVLAECLGAGLVEVFETGSVGPGARILAR